MEDVITSYSSSSAVGLKALPTMDPSVAIRLSSALECFEQCQAGSVLLARQLRSQGVTVCVPLLLQSRPVQ